MDRTAIARALGRPRFQACIQLDGEFYGSLRPMGVPEFRALTRDTIRGQVS